MNDIVAHLVVKKGPQLDKEYPLTEENTVIGRGRTSEINISDPEISRQHAQINRGESGFSIDDMGSTNGTFVNGQRVVRRTPLNDGDLINLGEEIQLAFRLPNTETEQVSPEPVSNVVEASLPITSPDAVVVEGQPQAPTPGTGLSRRRWILGCGCGCLVLVFLCAATLFFLDAYDQGRLLYCGPLQSLFELILGPFGFSPACALP